MRVCENTHNHARTEAQTDAITEHYSLGSIILSSSSDMRWEFNVIEDTI